MMRDAAKGKFGYVIAWKSNRMGRNMMEAMINDARLRDLGVRCLYTEEDFDDTAAGRFALRNMMNVNQFYSENMAEDIKRGLNDNAEKCMVNGALGLGFKKGEDGRYALDEPKAAIVREVYERVADLEPFVDIYNDLNARGLKTSTGKPWNRSSFHRMLVNERYRGVYIWGDIRIEGGIPRVVSDPLFFRVQEVLKTKKMPKGGTGKTEIIFSQENSFVGTVPLLWWGYLEPVKPKINITIISARKSGWKRHVTKRVSAGTGSSRRSPRRLKRISCRTM